MYKALLVVFAVLAVASAQYLASPYSAYYGGYSGAAVPAYSGAAVPAYSAYSYGSYPYAYSNLGYSGLYGSSYLYR